MSHPPETSRQLAERIWVCADDHSLADDYPERWKEKAASLIEAWVRVREAEALRDKLVDLLPRLQGHYSVLRDFQVQLMQAEIKDAESALATARKQLEGATHGQAEAPSAAASANSEPGGV